MKLKDVIKQPIITEKSTQMASLGRYTFAVDKRANKIQIAQAVKKTFDVHPQKVWTSRIQGGRKKAIVQLAEGEKIDAFKTGE